MNPPLALVGIGCGGRTLTYCGLAAAHPHRFRIVGGADPNAFRVGELQKISGDPDFRTFDSADSLFAAGRFADIAVIGTQDAYHVAPAIRAMEAGYDVLLEKPIAQSPEEVLLLLDMARRLGRRVMVCHVLRFSPLYTKVKEILSTGILGDIVALDAREGVGAWHQAHSYVRGHWADTSKATPMLVAKSCHDLDLISWFLERPCLEVSSFGALSHFTAANAPEGAPERCTDGCPVSSTCFYNALHYADRERSWLHPMDGGFTASPEEIRSWVAKSPWGRCVYRCNNDAVDHQVVSMRFERNATATFTMTAFDEGRDLIICGTKATLTAGHALRSFSGQDILVEEHSGEVTGFKISTSKGGYAGHGGADEGLVEVLDSEMRKPIEEMRSGLPASVESHLIAYAAEKSRHTGRTVQVAELRGKTALTSGGLPG